MDSAEKLRRLSRSFAPPAALLWQIFGRASLLASRIPSEASSSAESNFTMESTRILQSAKKWPSMINSSIEETSSFPYLQRNGLPGN
jgi:hypothetical protein